MSAKKLDDVTKFEHDETRDDRFKHILHGQFGEFGLLSLVNQSIIFILALVMIVSIMIGFITTSAKNENMDPFKCYGSTALVIQ